MDILTNFLSEVLKYIYGFTAQMGFANYGLAIILFTVAVKAVLYPLTYKQVRSMRRMQELQPKVQNIQKKFKGNPQKSQEAMMQLYKDEGVNPLSGCLPLLVQMPILFALFSVLNNFFSPGGEGANANASFLWIKNLGASDPTYILPVLVAAATFVQQKVSMVSLSGTSASDQTQKTMLYIMPLVIGWMSINFPAGLSLYWVVYSLVGIVEQWIGKKGPALFKKEEVSTK